MLLADYQSYIDCEDTLDAFSTAMDCCHLVIIYPRNDKLDSSVSRRIRRNNLARRAGINRGMLRLGQSLH